MKYRIRCASLEVDMELGEAEPLNGVISGLLGSLAGSALSKGFPSIGGLGGDDDDEARARLRAKVADLRAERERRAAAQDDAADGPAPPDKPPSH